MPTQHADLGTIRAVMAKMRAELAERLRQEGYARSAIKAQNLVDLRYRGQSSEITVALHGELDESELRAAEERFEQEFERTYGHRGQTKSFELVTCRVIVSVARSAEHAETWAADRAAGARADRLGYFGARLGVLPMPVLDRAAVAGQARDGPLVVQEYDTSVIVPPGCSASLDARGSIVIEVGNV
jgi:N-methylhydantoinase A